MAGYLFLYYKYQGRFCQFSWSYPSLQFWGLGVTYTLRELREMVNPDQLQVGDHIYTWRAVGYSHHGIYVGEMNQVKYVIHFVTTGSVFSSISSVSRPKHQACQVCGYAENVNRGVVKTCLDCFLSGDKLEVRQYNGKTKPCDEVVEMAYKLLEKGFGQYDLVVNNCEHFATFCKIGDPSSAQVGVFVGIGNLAPGTPFQLFSAYHLIRKWTFRR
ncbi:protein LEAD-SENSITIVE 1 [Manihot esculenta]|uniref:LRAT domain-containing protein n=1 Tax=Manihot esculenta TaxID=3983 RepID=A0A2C9VB08_MANES|nr:protein LEAD-SENSITIVE 1 [Manihot esculenta]